MPGPYPNLKEPAKKPDKGRTYLGIAVNILGTLGLVGTAVMALPVITGKAALAVAGAIILEKLGLWGAATGKSIAAEEDGYPQ